MSLLLAPLTELKIDIPRFQVELVTLTIVTASVCFFDTRNDDQRFYTGLHFFLIYILSGGLLLFSQKCALQAKVPFTVRWPLMVPLQIVWILEWVRIGIHMVGWIHGVDWLEPGGARFAFYSIKYTSMSLLIVSVALVIFVSPPVELPDMKGPHTIGFVETELLLDNNEDTKKNDEDSKEPTSMPVRIFYPTDSVSSSSARPSTNFFLHPATGEQVCHSTLRFGMPGLAKISTQVFYGWRLVSLRGVCRNDVPRNVQLNGTDDKSKPSLIVFSHGLGGNSEIYTYQCLALATQLGIPVLQVNHLDGSSCAVPSYGKAATKKPLMNFGPGRLQKEGKMVEYVHVRRQGTEQRAGEVVRAIKALQRMKDGDEKTLEWAVQHCNVGWDTKRQNNMKLKELLQKLSQTMLSLDQKKTKIIVMGHSFGAATALTVAARHPDLVHSIVAHEPAMDWLPDDVRGAVLDAAKAKSTKSICKEKRATLPCMHTSPSSLPLLLLFSQQWYDDGTYVGVNELVDWYRQKKQDGKDSISSAHVVVGSAHFDFSDLSMLSPALGLARYLGATGAKNPCHTALDIHERSVNFLTDLSAIAK